MAAPGLDGSLLLGRLRSGRRLSSGWLRAGEQSARDVVRLAERGEVTARHRPRRAGSGRDRRDPAARRCRRGGHPADALRIAADAWLEIASEPEVRQVVLLDAPSVLGWAGFREISQRYGLGMTEQLLSATIESGELKPLPTRPLATILNGALDETAISIANSPDPVQEKADVRTVIHNLIDGLLGGSGPAAEHRP